MVGASRDAGALGLEAPISGPTAMPTAGTHLESSSAKLTLVRTLGEGAFSSVWLATDDAGTLVSEGLSQSQSRPETLRRKSSSWAKKGRDKRMQGIKPPTTINASVLGKEFAEAENADGSLILDEQDGEGAIAATENSTQTMRPTGKLVAVKMIDRALCDADDRTRISFVREVEVLRVRFCYLSFHSIVLSRHIQRFTRILSTSHIRRSLRTSIHSLLIPIIASCSNTSLVGSSLILSIRTSDLPE